ncbi:MAG: type II toxin-antitoxin system PemK/MazF family toxin [Planctomycetota bacterium]
MARVLRGHVVWADLNPVRGHEQGGHRPVLVLSRGVFNERSGTVIAAAITSRLQRASFPLTLEIKSARLPNRSWVKISQVRTLSTERLGDILARLSTDETNRVVEGLRRIVGS